MADFTRQLPPELVSQIFALCLPLVPQATNADPFTGAYPRALYAPMLLTQVCARWRTIAISTPILWSVIRLGENGSVELLCTWLKRSGNASLTVLLSKRSEWRGKLLLTTIFAHADRLEDLRLTNLSQKALFYQLASLFRENHFPRLRRFDILHTLPLGDVPGTLRKSVRIQITRFNAPLLRVVGIAYHDKLSFSLPWTKLAVMEVYGLFPAALDHIRRCQKLRTIAFYHDPERAGGGGGASDNVPLLPLVHKGLRRLRATEAHLLDHLTLPQLTSLDIAAAGSSARVPSLCAFLTRSHCRLKRLAWPVNHNAVNITQFPRLLPFLEDLTQLKLAFACETVTAGMEQLLDALAAPTVMPRLAALEVEDARERGAERAYAALRRLVQARSAGALREFRLRICPSSTAILPTGRQRGRPNRPPVEVNQSSQRLTREAMDELRVLVASGMRVRVVTLRKRGSVEEEIVLVDSSGVGT